MSARPDPLGAAGRRIFLHVGTHKTGTTAIQVLLDRHHADLERCGFVYPPLARAPEGPNGHHNLAWEITGDRRFNPANGTIAQLAHLLEQTAHHAIVSSEDFEGAVFHERRFSDFVRRLRDAGRSVTFIVYLRRQADYAESLYQTLVRMELPHTFSEFSDEILKTGRFAWREWIFPFRYTDLLDRLEAVREATVVVRSYEAPPHPPLVADFFSVVGLDAAAMGVAMEFAANVRLPLVEYLPAFCQNRRGVPLDTTEIEIVRALSPYLDGRGLRMSPALRQAFSERFRESNAIVRAKYRLPAWEPDAPGQETADAPPLDRIFSARLIETVARLSHLVPRIPTAREPDQPPAAVPPAPRPGAIVDSFRRLFRRPPGG